MKKLTVIFCLFATVALGQRVLNLSTTIRNQLIAQGLEQNNSGNIDVFELAKFLDSKEVKQNGKSKISYGKSVLVITMTSEVNGIKYIGPGKTPSEKFTPFQYVKIKATGFMTKPEPKPKNQITSWRLQIGAQMK